MCKLPCLFNEHKSLENRHDEKEIKAQSNSNIQPRPELHKKKDNMNSENPYRKLRRVPLAEKAKTFRLTSFREIGNLALYLRYKGCLLMCNQQVAITRRVRLFNKNTDLS